VSTIGSLRCDKCVVKTICGQSVLYCKDELTVFPYYPLSKVQLLLTQCSDCSALKVSCIECGADISKRAREHAKVVYCTRCRNSPY
jgi:hypothetical protein